LNTDLELNHQTTINIAKLYSSASSPNGPTLRANIIQWAKGKGVFTDDLCGKNSAVMDWFSQNIDLSIYNSREMRTISAELAVRDGRIDVLRWLHLTFNMDFTPYRDLALEGGKLGIVMWIDKIGK
jgi:hypothetical protein